MSTLQQFQPNDDDNRNNLVQLVPPPPYQEDLSNIKTGTDGGGESMDSKLYAKLVNLETMVSNIHLNVVDFNSYNMDVNHQLEEIKDSLEKFQKEASIRIRKKISRTGSKSQFNSNYEAAQVSDEAGASDCLSEAVEEDKVTKESDKDSYLRVCSMVESLISDANQVLHTTKVGVEDDVVPNDDRDSTDLKLNVVVKCDDSTSHSTNLKLVSSLNSNLILPIYLLLSFVISCFYLDMEQCRKIGNLLLLKFKLDQGTTNNKGIKLRRVKAFSTKEGGDCESDGEQQLKIYPKLKRSNSI